ncbi:MAG: MFS transporter [Betaproteobacteria bacterium]|nr:MFS transporter [Betaproteobacteria bacterium]
MIPGSGAWLAALCTSRVLAATWFVAYSSVLPLTQVAWGLSAKEAGMIQAAFHLGYLTSLFIVGFVADHLGARRAYIMTGVVACVSPWTFVLFADGFWSAFWLHAFTGLCQGGTYTPALALINEHVARERRGRAMGYLIAGSSAGYALCLGVAGVALKFTDWRGALAMVALLPVSSWLLAAFVLRGTPNVVHPRPAGEPLLAALPAVLSNRRGMLSIWAYTLHNWELLGPVGLAAGILDGGASRTWHGRRGRAAPRRADLCGEHRRLDHRRHHGGSLGAHSNAAHLVVHQHGAFVQHRLAGRSADRGSRPARPPLQLLRHRRLVDALHRARRGRPAALHRRRLCGALGDWLWRRRGQSGRLRLGAGRGRRRAHEHERFCMGHRMVDARAGRIARPGRHLAHAQILYHVAR